MSVIFLRFGIPFIRHYYLIRNSRKAHGNDNLNRNFERHALNSSQFLNFGLTIFHVTEYNFIF